jgi:protein polybromo-1
MKSNEYDSLEHLDSDLTRMLENGKRFNVPHSSIYKRALKLQHIQQVCLHPPPPSSSSSWRVS